MPENGRFCIRNIRFLQKKKVLRNLTRFVLPEKAAFAFILPDGIRDSLAIERKPRFPDSREEFSHAAL